MSAAPAVTFAARGRARLQIRDVRDARWMLGLGGLALATRLALIVSVPNRPWVLNDTFFYHSVGARLAEGHGYTLLDGSPTAGWPPVWTFMVSLVYRVFGPDQKAGYVLN